MVENNRQDTKRTVCAETGRTHKSCRKSQHPRQAWLWCAASARFGPQKLTCQRCRRTVPDLASFAQASSGERLEWPLMLSISNVHMHDRIASLHRMWGDGDGGMTFAWTGSPGADPIRYILVVPSHWENKPPGISSPTGAVLYLFLPRLIFDSSGSRSHVLRFASLFSRHTNT
jgi:hypothetical protein